MPISPARMVGLELEVMAGARLRYAVAAALIALLALVATLPASRLRPFHASVYSPPPPTPSSAGATVPGLDAFIPVAESFVSSHRGLDYVSTVQVTLLGDAAFQARVAADVRSSASDYDKEGKVLGALGLVPAGTNVEQAEESFEKGGVLGYYDPKTKQLVVRGGALTVSVKHVLVHELTHALQDQHFDLGKRPTGNDERELAYVGLVEGDAVRIESQYIDSLTSAEKAQLRREDAASVPDLSGVPAALIQLDLFPYEAGPSFVETLYNRRGQAGLDAAFAAPPTTSAQLLHPDLYIGGTGAVAVPAPAAEGDVLDRGAVGELGFEVLLLQLAQTGKLSAGAARQAAAEWQGDSYVAWPSAGATCVRDSLAGGADLRSALAALAGSRSGMTLSGEGSTFSFTACA